MDHPDKLYSSYISLLAAHSSNKHVHIWTCGQWSTDFQWPHILGASDAEIYYCVSYNVHLHYSLNFYIYACTYRIIVILLRYIFAVTMVLKLNRRNRKLGFNNFVQPVVSTIGFPCLRMIVYISPRYSRLVSTYIEHKQSSILMNFR